LTFNFGPLQASNPQEKIDANSNEKFKQDIR